MRYELPPLPYPQNALTPHISAETIEFHYGKHHKAYVDTMNKLLTGTPLEKERSLEDIVRAAPQGPVFNNSAQVWNHNFYWQSLRPQGGAPNGKLAQLIDKGFGSFAKFQEMFTQKALGQFGSGWTWLILKDGALAVESTSNAATPLTSGGHPLLTCDVWEHAYYIDYRNARAKYLESFWKIANWDFAAKNLEAAALVSFPEQKR
ncbi:MAG: superoxide dismutase [Elusimicrobia bacterium]|nr:superoxide dismutase [Elusimicrobiota bacterium]